VLVFFLFLLSLSLSLLEVATRTTAMEEGRRGDREAKSAAGWTALSTTKTTLEEKRRLQANGSVGGDAGTSGFRRIVRLFFACMVAGGIQYGWALQLSLLSPYSQVSYSPTCLSLFLFVYLGFALHWSVHVL
jgi:hypothetical protein